MLLTRKTWQYIFFHITSHALKRERKGTIPWDEPLTEDLIDSWTDYFAMLMQIEAIKLRRSIVLDNYKPGELPVLVTFNDGNLDSFGVMAYALWNLNDGSKKTSIILAKAKLAPILQIGDSYRNELCSAVFAVRLKTWIYEQTGLEFGEHVSFLD